MPIRYYCSNGSRVSQAQIDKNYRHARAQKYAGMHPGLCHGCNNAPPQGNAHIIAQARCKTLHKAELIWDPKGFFPACGSCNQAIENPKGEAWKELKNINYCLEFIERHDPELFIKFQLQLG